MVEINVIIYACCMGVMELIYCRIVARGMGVLYVWCGCDRGLCV